MEKINNQMSISTVGSLLMGAGLAKLDNVQLALILIGVGALLKIAVAILQRNNIPVEAESIFE